MYKNYEDKLNTILSNAKGERIELKTVELVNKSINKIKALGDGSRLIETIRSSKKIYDTTGKEYDKLQKEIKKLSNTEDKLMKVLGDSEKEFKANKIDLNRLEREYNTLIAQLEYNTAILKQTTKRLGLKNPPEVKQGEAELKKATRIQNSFYRALDLNLK